VNGERQWLNNGNGFTPKPSISAAGASLERILQADKKERKALQLGVTEWTAV